MFKPSIGLAWRGHASHLRLPTHVVGAGDDHERYQVLRHRVVLTGTDGNAYAIIGRVRRALHEAGVSDVEVEEFTAEATSGDYDHPLRTCMRWVDVA
ncbi:MAG TPA: hypothetical protein VF086_08980 [Propionibacteriaceae bacterium]